MKKLFATLMNFLVWQQVFSQVAISTTNSTPHSSAMLEVKSTTKGLLLPRMTTINRLSIASPADGLMVYDTDNEKLYVYQNGWRAMIDNTYWTKSTTRDRVYNSSDSIGIGTSIPTERLDVNGNIRSRGRIEADGVVEAHGVSSIGSLYVSGTSLLTGSVTGNSAASFSGNINSNTGMSITDAAGILQFKNGSADKGFLQLSGDDLRVGTNSSNTNGTFIIRTSGADQFAVDGTFGATFFRLYNDGVHNSNMIADGDNLSINTVGASSKLILNNEVYVDINNSRTGFGTINPEQRIHVVGNIKQTSGNVLNNNNENMLPLAYGKFSNTGSKLAGTSNISAVAATVNGDEYFVVSVAGEDLSNAVATVTDGFGTASGRVVSVRPHTDATKLKVRLANPDGGGLHSDFHIIIYKTN